MAFMRNQPQYCGTSFTHAWYHFGQLIASRSLKIAPPLLPFNKAILRTLITTVFFSSSGTYGLCKGTLSTVALKNLLTDLKGDLINGKALTVI